MTAPAPRDPSMPPPTILRLRVRNHPGTMSHVCGLFARRSFNVEGILCRPIGDGRESVILLEISDPGRLEQVIRQLEKLDDVLAVREAPDGAAAFTTVARMLGGC